MRVALLVAVLGTRPTALVAQSVDCATSLQELSTQLNQRCCNGGGHRRTQSGACAFTECSEECADLLVPLFRDCRELVVSPHLPARAQDPREQLRAPVDGWWARWGGVRTRLGPHVLGGG